MGGRGGARGGGGGGGGATKRPEESSGLEPGVPKQRPDGAWVTTTPNAGTVAHRKGLVRGQTVDGQYRDISRQSFNVRGKIVGFTTSDVMIKSKSTFYWIDGKNIFRLRGKKG